MKAGDDTRRRILKFLSSYYDRHRQPPTILEIGGTLQMARGHVAYHLDVLMRKGAVRKIGPPDRVTARCYVAVDWP